MFPSGEQFEIKFGDQSATVVEVGGGVRRYDVGDRAVLHPFDADSMCDGAHGMPLIPWPNRLRDGKYSFHGFDHQVALTEPAKNNAIHGFLRWRSWQATQHTATSVTMHTCLHPMKGYPFALDVSATYELSAVGLAVTVAAINVGNVPLPYGFGQHPYLSPGSGLIDDCELRFAAGTRIVTDPERQLPTGTEEVRGTDFDFAAGRKLGGTRIDFAFTDVERDDDLAWVRLTGPDGHTAGLWADQSIDFIELYTADTLEPARRRAGLGVEPMTCPPNAFGSGEGIIELAPGESTVAKWGARLD